jgi:hypothetical protein
MAEEVSAATVLRYGITEGTGINRQKLGTTPFPYSAAIDAAQSFSEAWSAV